MKRKVLAGIMAAVLAMTGIFTAVACSGEKGKFVGDRGCGH